MQNNPKCGLSGECINILAVALANTIAQDLTIDEVGQLSTILSAVGGALSVIAATRSLCEENSAGQEIPTV